jgi:hypothetical protein
LRLSSAKRSNSAATSPAGTQCFDIFSPAPGDSDVTSQTLRLNSNETKIAVMWVWMAAGTSERSDVFGIFLS